MKANAQIGTARTYPATLLWKAEGGCCGGGPSAHRQRRARTKTA